MDSDVQMHNTSFGVVCIDDKGVWVVPGHRVKELLIAERDRWTNEGEPVKGEK